MDKCKIPRINSDYITIYHPVGNRYDGPDGKELKSGMWYDCWVPNDHTVILGPDENWHIFGITHPLTSAVNIHEGEVQLFHAVASRQVFDENHYDSVFQDKPLILPPKDRSKEISEIHSPFIVKKDALYYMVYGPSPMRLATSVDLYSWELKGEIFYESDGCRDPHVLYHNNRYFMTYCSLNEVRVRESEDLLNWKKPQTILTLPDGIAPESPLIIFHNNMFYLFVCCWDGNWDYQTVTQAYQHKTLVYVADKINNFIVEQPVNILDAHAPEIFIDSNKYFISSAEWPTRGISVAQLTF